MPFYLNGLTGNDGNDGSTPALAVLTPARLKVVMGSSPNALYYVAADSFIRGTLDTSNCPGAVGDIYAGINQPIFTGDDILAAGSFTKTAGKTNVYQADGTTETGTSYQNSLEGNTFLIRAADIDAVDATPGTFIPCAVGTTTPQVEQGALTFYIHPFGSTDPRSDGKTYTFTKRRFGYVDHTGGTNVVKNMTFRRPHEADGNMTLWGRMENCKLLDGPKHNGLLHLNASVDACVVNGYYWGAGQATMLVCNDDNPSGAAPSVTNCIITGKSPYDVGTVGIQIHRNATNSTYSALHFQGNRVTNVATAVTGGDTDLFDISGNTFSGVDLGVDVDGNVALQSNTISAANAAIQMINQSAPHVFTIQNNTLSLDGTVNFAKGIIYGGGSSQASSVLIEGNTFTNPVTAWCINFIAAGSPFTLRNNRFTGNYYIQFSAADLVSARNDRFLTPPAGIFNIDGVTRDIAYFQATFGDVPVDPPSGGKAPTAKYHPWLGWL